MARGPCSSRSRLVLGSLSLLLFATGPAHAVEASSAAGSAGAASYEALVDVGAYHLNYRVIAGTGAVILLESGGGFDASQWDALAPSLARETGATVVAYDRAGYGKSDLPVSRYDLREDTSAMWRGLQKLGLAHDLILVGHSYGGFLIRYVASQHPEAVRGLVFVDPFTVELVDALGIDFCNNHPGLGKLPFDLSRPELLGKTEQAAARDEGAPGHNLADKMAVMRKARVPRGLPVRVITSGTAWLPPEFLPVWRPSHERFASSVEGAKLVVAEASDHMVHLRQPELLVSVVAEVVRQAGPSRP